MQVNCGGLMCTSNVTEFDISAAYGTQTVVRYTKGKPGYVCLPVYAPDVAALAEGASGRCLRPIRAISRTTRKLNTNELRS
ncbi:hypothetical protein EVAR_23649_1 [Eumeta japonica]|uniref:Uncharacterized protein n=1 Tax=Eumeta variegata TaxID=151549 RepID=A0A4C1VKP6_EUMVA|nr:hypothetical protein EVAR_23649_1 [Eumeta japonica]